MQATTIKIKAQGKTMGGAILLCTMALFLFCAMSSAQIAGTASIQGTVTDPTGAVIPNASVTATNDATQVKHVVKTNGSGLYSLPNLAIGTYSIDVTASGFQKYHQTGIVLDVGSSIAVNVSLKIGNQNQTVQVQANGLSLQTQNVSLSQTVTGSDIVNLPLNGRLTSSLVLLTGGTVNDNTGNDITGSKNFVTAYAPSLAGSQANQTMVYLDGANNMQYQTNTGMPLPFPDATSQFSVETTALTATTGLHPGGVINVVTKSGTNHFHGDAFEFIRNNIINATSFFSTTKDQLHLNQVGGVIGGPIVRNKMFFFVGYQKLLESQAASNKTSYVPTAANLAGDFSASDPTIQLVDPVTGITLVNNNYADTPGVTWSPNAQALALDKYFPATTAADGLVTYSIPSTDNENQIITREDVTINQKNSLYGRYFLDGYTAPADYSSTNVLVTTSPGNYQRDQEFTLGEVYTPTSSLVNTFHLTFTRQRNNRGPASPGINATTIGINTYQVGATGLEITTSNKWSTYCGTCFLAKFNSNFYGIADDVNWVHGKNQVAFGGEFARAQFNSTNVYEGNGYFTFSGLASKTGPLGQSTGGTGEDSNLDFLTGVVDAFQQSATQGNALRAPITALYITDTYRASSKVVLSAGVRWSPEFYQTDNWNGTARGAVFSAPDFLANIHSTVYPGAGAGTFYYGDPGVPKNFTKNSPFQFSPRFGVTYSLSGKTVMRAGAALVYDEPNFFTSERMQDDAPWGEEITNAPVTAPVNFTDPWTSGTSITSDPYPAALVPSKNETFPLGTQFIGLTGRFRTPEVLQWTLSVQHNFGRGWQAEADYIGNKSSFLPIGDPMSQAIYIPGTWGANGTGCSPIATTGPNAVKPGAAGTACSTTGNEASRFVLTTENPAEGPYYAGGGSSVIVDPAANASYNGAIFSLQHRLSSTFLLMTNYTWSHCIDISDASGDTSGSSVRDIYDLKLDKGNCGFDYRSIYNLSLVAMSHFSLANRLLSELVNNWTISPIVKITDGAPFGVNSGIDTSLTDVGNDNPDLTHTSPVFTHATLRSGPASNANYMNKAAFSTPASGLDVFGTLGRNTFRGPKQLQDDVSLNRAFPVHEGMAVNLRLDSFNLLNHPDFGNPSNSLTSSTFGDITGTNYNARLFQGSVKFTF